MSKATVLSNLKTARAHTHAAIDHLADACDTATQQGLAPFLLHRLHAERQSARNAARDLTELISCLERKTPVPQP